MELTWHGHSAWHVELNGTSLLIDPFFDNPHTSLDPDDVGAPDVLLVTHGHADHIADVGAFTGATLVSTPEIVEYLDGQHGFPDAIGMNIGGTVAVGDVHVTMHRADHTNGLGTSYEHEVGMPTGFVVSDDVPTHTSDRDATAFYHAGDTGLMTEMRDVIGPYLEPDVAALPVGDHFTMGPTQAAIAVDWLDVDYALPMHYDTFPPIEIDVDRFEREVRATGSDAEVVVLDGDGTFTYDE